MTAAPICAHCVTAPAVTAWRKYRVCEGCRRDLTASAKAGRVMDGHVSFFLRDQQRPWPTEAPPVRVVEEMPPAQLHYQPPEPSRDLVTDLKQLARANRKRGSW